MWAEVVGESVADVASPVGEDVVSEAAAVTGGGERDVCVYDWFEELGEVLVYSGVCAAE